MTAMRYAAIAIAVTLAISGVGAGFYAIYTKGYESGAAAEELKWQKAVADATARADDLALQQADLVQNVALANLSQQRALSRAAASTRSQINAYDKEMVHSNSCLGKRGMHIWNETANRANRAFAATAIDVESAVSSPAPAPAG